MGGGVAGSSKQRSTRSDGPLLDIEAEFPPMKCYEPKSKLPTVKSVVGMIRYHTGKGGVGKSAETALREVAKQTYAKWYHDTVACKSLPTISWSIFTEGKKRYSEGVKFHNQAIVQKFLGMVSEKGKLFDVYQENMEKRKAVEAEWGVTMSQMEFTYYV